MNADRSFRKKRSPYFTLRSTATITTKLHHTCNNIISNNKRSPRTSNSYGINSSFCSHSDRQRSLSSSSNNNNNCKSSSNNNKAPVNSISERAVKFASPTSRRTHSRKRSTRTNISPTISGKKWQSRWRSANVRFVVSLTQKCVCVTKKIRTAFIENYPFCL